MKFPRPIHLLALGALLPPLAALADTVESFSLAGERVALYDLAGEVHIEPGTGKEVVVEVRRGGADGAKLSVAHGAVASMPDWQTLRVIYPEDDVVYPPLSHSSRSEVEVREDGTFNGAGKGPGKRRSVTIRGGGSGMEAWADLRVLVPAGRQLDVNLGVGAVAVSNVDGKISIDSSSGDVTAKGIRGSLDVDVGSGNVEAEDSHGRLGVDTGSGDVRFDRFDGDEIVVDTGSGNVSSTGVKASEIRVDTGSGNIELQAVTSPSLSLDTGSGDVELDLASDVDHLDVDTGSGSVDVRVPPALGASVELEAGSGSVRSEVAMTSSRQDDENLRGTLGDGKGRITLETGSGSIRLLKR